MLPLQVYVAPFPGPGPRIPVSAGGGHSSLWSPDGRELYYVQGDAIMAVTVGRSATMSVSAPRKLFEGRFRGNPNTLTPFDIAPDGRRFIRVQQAQPDRAVTRRSGVELGGPVEPLTISIDSGDFLYATACGDRHRRLRDRHCH